MKMRVKNSEEFINKFNISVMRQDTGTLYGLLWYTYNEGQNFLISKTITGLYAMWLRTWYKRGGPTEVRELWEMNVVSPPTRLLRMWSEYQAASVVNLVRRLVVSLCQTPNGEISIPNTLADVLSVCTKETTEETNYHYDCDRCLDGIIFSSKIDSAKLAEELMEEGTKYNYGYNNGYNTPVLNLPQASEEPVYVVSTDFGHHHRGVNITPLTEDNVTTLPATVGLFFQGKQLEIPTVYKDKMEEWRRENKNRAKERSSELQRKRAKYFEEGQEKLKRAILNSIVH